MRTHTYAVRPWTVDKASRLRTLQPKPHGRMYRTSCVCCADTHDSAGDVPPGIHASNVTVRPPSLPWPPQLEAQNTYALSLNPRLLSKINDANLFLETVAHSLQQQAVKEEDFPTTCSPTTGGAYSGDQSIWCQGGATVHDLVQVREKLRKSLGEIGEVHRIAHNQFKVFTKARKRAIRQISEYVSNVSEKKLDTLNTQYRDLINKNLPKILESSGVEPGLSGDQKATRIEDGVRNLIGETIQSVDRYLLSVINATTEAGGHIAAARDSLVIAGNASTTRGTPPVRPDDATAENQRTTYYERKMKLRDSIERIPDADTRTKYLKALDDVSNSDTWIGIVNDLNTDKLRLLDASLGASLKSASKSSNSTPDGASSELVHAFFDIVDPPENDWHYEDLTAGSKRGRGSERTWSEYFHGDTSRPVYTGDGARQTIRLNYYETKIGHESGQKIAITNISGANGHVSGDTTDSTNRVPVIPSVDLVESGVPTLPPNAAARFTPSVFEEFVVP